MEAFFQRKTGQLTEVLVREEGKTNIVVQIMGQ